MYETHITTEMHEKAVDNLRSDGQSIRRRESEGEDDGEDDGEDGGANDSANVGEDDGDGVVGLHSTPTAPASADDAAPKGPTEMLGSAAIISARTSRIGCALVRVWPDQGIFALRGAHLGHGLVVDRDQVSWLRVHLESLVEAECCVDRCRACESVSSAWGRSMDGAHRLGPALLLGPPRS